MSFAPDIVALLLLLALELSGILTPQEAFSGFSRSAVIIMISAFILAEGLGNFILRLFGNGEMVMAQVVMHSKTMPGWVCFLPLY